MALCANLVQLVFYTSSIKLLVFVLIVIDLKGLFCSHMFDKPWVGCETIEVLTTGINPAFTDGSFVVWYSIEGWCDPDDELISLLGSGALVVVVNVGDVEPRASKHSLGKKEILYYNHTSGS